MRFLQPAVFGLLGTAALSLAEGSGSTSALDAYPQCAQTCIATAFGGEYCAPTDLACICTNAAYKTNVSTCVAVSCTIPEGLRTQNASLTACNAPVRDHGPELKAISNAMLVLCLVAVAARFGYKLFLSSVELGLDDWTVLVAAISAVPSIAIANHGTIPNGLGKDIWTVEPERITKLLHYFYMMAWLYFLQTTLVKLSFITFFVRIFPSKNVQRLLWGTFIFVAAWGFAFVIAAIFQCRPISYFWTKWDGMHSGTCLEINAITWANAGMGIGIDIWIVAIPLWQLRELKLHWKKKVGVATMFCVGAFVTIVSILRLRSLVDFAKSSNVTWGFYDVSVWSTVEVSIGIVCACLPSIRLLFVHFFPILGGSSMRSTTNGYRQYPDDPHTKNTRSFRQTITATTKRDMDRSGDHGSMESDFYNTGISRRIDFEIDEVNLVNLPSKEDKGATLTVQIRSEK